MISLTTPGPSYSRAAANIFIDYGHALVVHAAAMETSEALAWGAAAAAAGAGAVAEVAVAGMAA